MIDQLELFTCQDDEPEPTADLCWRMQTYLRCTGRAEITNESDYSRWIDQRWAEFYAEHPDRARRAGETEHAWFPRFLDNQDPFDDWLRARIDAGERPVSRMIPERRRVAA